MNYKGCVPIIFVLTLLPSFLNAQEMNDEFKKRIRESIMIPDNPPPQLLQHQNPLPLELQRENSEVLKVSPFTRLPTKYDIFLNSPKPVELVVKMHIIPSNAPPSTCDRQVPRKLCTSRARCRSVPTGESWLIPAGWTLTRCVPSRIGGWRSDGRDCSVCWTRIRIPSIVLLFISLLT